MVRWISGSHACRLPKPLQAMIGHLMRAKHRFEEITPAFKFQLVEEPDGERSDGKHPEGEKRLS